MFHARPLPRSIHSCRKVHEKLVSILSQASLFEKLAVCRDDEMRDFWLTVFETKFRTVQRQVSKCMASFRDWSSVGVLRKLDHKKIFSLMLKTYCNFMYY